LHSVKFKQNGSLKEPGPPLTRYDLGDSGISALFPLKPEKYDAPLSHQPNAQIVHRFTASYAFRMFAVLCRDSTPQEVDSLSVDKRSQLYAASIEEIAQAFKTKTGNQQEFKIGKDVGSRTELIVAGIAKGAVAVFLHGSHLVTIVEIGPEKYNSPGTVEEFLGSLQFK